METILIEVRAGEGGADAKLLVEDQIKLYLKFCQRKGYEVVLVEQLPGFVALQITGRGVKDFKNETGGHRYQRIPPTEKRGRVQTSTVTVACLTVPSESEFKLREEDLEWSFCRSGGAGGQHVQKTNSAVQLTHKPTKTSVRCETERSQHQNKISALAVLRSRVSEWMTTQTARQLNTTRKNQVGAGMRGDKRRTIALQRDQVVDHVSEKRISAKEYLNGKLELVW